MKSTGFQNMNTHTNHKQPALHNAMWPGVVGKGAGSEPPIDLDTMLKLTAAADVDGVKFDGVDLFLTSPHTAIDSSDEDLKRLSDKIASFGLVIGSLVAPVWERRAAARPWEATTSGSGFWSKFGRLAASAGDCVNWVSDVTASFASIPQLPPRNGRRIRRRIPSASRIHFARHATSPMNTERG